MTLKSVDLPPEYLAALGSIVVHSGRLEDALTSVLARAVGGNATGVLALLGSDSLNAKIDKLQLIASREIRFNNEPASGALNRVVGGDMAEMLAGLARRCNRAREGRNRMVHCVWRLNEHGEVVRTRQTLRNRLRLEQAVTTLDEIQAIADELRDAVQAVANASFDQLTGEVRNDWGIPHDPGL